MGKPRHRASLGLAILLAACGSCAGDDAAQESRIVLTVVLDALHAGHVRHLGYERETTPQLDALAAQGVSFTRASAPAPYTVASTVSLMTGLLPQRHGILRRYGKHARPLGTTLAEELSHAGWQCFGATATSNAGLSTGITWGFDEWYQDFEQSGQDPAISMQLDDGRWVPLIPADFWPGHLERILARRDPARDCFIYLHVIQPHSPYLPPREHLELFADPEYESSWKGEELPRGFASGLTSPLVLANQGQLAMTAADRQHTIDLYDASLHWADAALGEMVEVLRAAEVWDSTWMIVTSDHGEAFWQHGRWGHNEQLYEESLRVPLVVRAPGAELPRGARCDRLVSPMDIMPSVLDWAGLPFVPGLDGRPLEETLSARGPDERELLFFTNSKEPSTGSVGPGMKLIVGPGPKGTPILEQYHLPSDPGERLNLAGDAPLAALAGAVADRSAESFGQDTVAEVRAGDEARMRGLWRMQDSMKKWVLAERARAGSLTATRKLFDVLLPGLDPPRDQEGAQLLLDALGYGGEVDEGDE